jgi:hypothetical protein
MTKSSSPASHLTTPTFTPATTGATGFVGDPTFGIDPSLSLPGLSGTGALATTPTPPSTGSTVSTSAAISGSGESSLAGSPPPPRNLTLSPIDINSSLGVQLGSQASLFEVSFAGFPIGLRRTSSSFISNAAGLLCHNAVLPGTSFGTADIYGVYQQVTQKYAHSRIYPTVSLTFYEDRSYKMITFFEDWQNYMTVTGTSSVNAQNYFYRMRYPSQYKCDTMFITKYERDYGLRPPSGGGGILSSFGIGGSGGSRNRGPLLQYQFLKVFPINFSSIPVSYGDTDILKVTIEFSYDRYLMKNNGLGADDGLRPSGTGASSPTGLSMESAAAGASAGAGGISPEMAAWALSNKGMIDKYGHTSATPGNDQPTILAQAQAAYPPGSPQLTALQAQFGF